MQMMPQMQWSDTLPDPIEINEMTDGTMEILVNECIVQVPDGWEFEQYRFVRDDGRKR